MITTVPFSPVPVSGLYSVRGWGDCLIFAASFYNRRMELIDVLGMIAGSISAVTFLPQVIKTWRTKSAGDISLLMFTFATVSVVLWLVYGIVKQSIPIIYTNSLVLICSLIMLYFKFRYSGKSEKEITKAKDVFTHED